MDRMCWLGDGSSCPNGNEYRIRKLFFPYPVVQLDKENSLCKESGQKENEMPGITACMHGWQNS